MTGSGNTKMALWTFLFLGFWLLSWCAAWATGSTMHDAGLVLLVAAFFGGAVQEAVG